MAAILNHLSSSTLLIPIVGAIAILLLGGRDRASHARWIAAGATLASLLRTGAFWLLYDPDGKTWQFAERWSGPVGVSFYVGVDGTSIVFLLLTSLIALVSVLASWNEIETRVRDFYAVLLLAQAGMFGVLIALDLLVFFLSWHVTLLCLYVLIRRGDGARRIPARFLAAVVGLSLVMLAGMVALYLVNPTGLSAYSSDITLLHTRTLPSGLQTWVFAAFVLAFSGTMALFPLHRWAVDAQTAGPTAVSVFVAALVTKLGTYGVFRLVLPVVPDASRQFAPVIVLIAIASVLFGALLALRQQQIRRLIAYATVSQAGLMIVGLFALTPAGIGGSIVRQLGHGIWITGLFACAASVFDRTGSRDVSGGTGLRRSMPVFAALFYVMALAATALSGPLRFVDEGWRFNRVGWASLASLAAILLTLSYVLRLLRPTISGEFKGAAGLRPGLSWRETAILVPLAAIAIGVVISPQPLLQRIETSVGRVVARIHPDMAPYLRLGSDCPTAAPPDPAGPPPGFILVQPCAEGK